LTLKAVKVKEVVTYTAGFFTTRQENNIYEKTLWFSISGSPLVHARPFLIYRPAAPPKPMLPSANKEVIKIMKTRKMKA